MMELFSQMKTADLLLKMTIGDRKKATPYVFVPEKKQYLLKPEKAPLPHSTPERQGVRSTHLKNFFLELDQCNEIHPHSVIVLRHGVVIAQAHWKPYGNLYAHMMYSLSKSVVGMAVGIAIEEGLFSIDDRLVGIFPEKLLPIRGSKINNLTVGHLLTMSTGVKFNEVGSATDKDWVKSFLQSEFGFEPGSEFSYNSMNTYLLSAIICKKSGMGLTDYLRPRLFEPLGIETIVWEKCPLGIEKGGWGLYLRPCEMAKLGQLYLQKGCWMVNGEKKQLIPQKWVEESTTMRIETMMGTRKAHYGYQIWSYPIKDAYQFNGVFGQYVIVMPNQDMVIAMTSGSQNLFMDVSSKMIKKYFDCNAGGNLVDFPLPYQKKELESLHHVLSNLYLIKETKPKCERKPVIKRLFGRFSRKSTVTSLSQGARTLDGKTYQLEKGYGTLLPFILEGVRNNFTDGILQIKFHFYPQSCLLEFWEDGEENQIEAGLDGIPRRGRLQVHGEVYEVGCTAILTTDEDKRTVLKLYVSFIEMPNTRLLKIIFYEENRIIVRFDESPSVLGAADLLCGLVGGSGNNLSKILKETIQKQKIEDLISSRAKPCVKGKLLEEQLDNSEKTEQRRS